MLTSFSETIKLEGNFQAYTFKKDSPEKLTLVFNEHNQIQNIGGKTLAEMITPNLSFQRSTTISNIDKGTFIGGGPDRHLRFSRIKASAEIYNDGTDSNAGLSKSGIVLPGEEILNNEKVKESNPFKVEYSTDLESNQIVKCEGTFTEMPQGYGTAVGEGAFIHFGLYMSRYKDAEEVLYAYKFLPRGLAFPEEAGLKIVWELSFYS